MQARYQYGNLMLRKRKKGPDVWQFRWVENGKQRSVLIGTLEKIPTQAEAERAVEYHRIKINAQSPQQQFHSVTVGALIDRFMKEYVPKHCRKPTERNYRGLFEKRIRPRWGTEYIQTVRTMAIEEWLDDLDGSDQLKSHVRRLMHTLFEAAIRWELAGRNPIDHIRRPCRRLKKPRVLSPEEFKALLTELAEPYKSMVITVGCLGLRVSELFGLQWRDIDFEGLTVKIERSFRQGQLYPTKTEASLSELPLDPDLAGILLAHKARVNYSGSSDFVFAGVEGKPRWPDIMLTDHIKPAAAKAGIGKIGWHTFRHSYSTLLHALGAAPAVQKELLRHADIQTTLNLYPQAVTPAKREAASKVVDVLWRN